MADIDEFLQHRLEGLDDEAWVPVLVQAEEESWSPPAELREQIQIVSQIGDVFRCSMTKRAIQALAQEPGVVRISQ